MNEKEEQELVNAISNLSEEDQMEIAGGRKLTNAQCNKIKEIAPYQLLVAYGGPIPISAKIKPLVPPTKKGENSEEKTNL